MAVLDPWGQKVNASNGVLKTPHGHWHEMHLTNRNEYIIYACISIHTCMTRRKEPQPKKWGNGPFAINVDQNLSLFCPLPPLWLTSVR